MDRGACALSLRAHHVEIMRITAVTQTVKPLTARRRAGLDPWVRKILWRRKWQPTPVFLPGKSLGLVGYSPWSRKESETTEQSHLQRSDNFDWED